MTMQNSFIKIDRHIKEQSWWSSNNARSVYFYCLMMADENGSFDTTLIELSSATGISVQQVRTALNKLEITNNITSRATNKLRTLTINGYDGCNAQQQAKQQAEQQAEQQTKEDKKADIYKQIVDHYNENADKHYSRVRKVSDKLKKAIDARMHSGYTVDDILKAITLMNSLGSFYKGENDRKWTADLLWLMSDTKGNFVRILEGGLHKSDLQKHEYEMVMLDKETADPNEYRPVYDEQSIIKPIGDGYFLIGKHPQYTDVPDGYNAETRPDGATLNTQYGKFMWSREQKRWIEKR